MPILFIILYFMPFTIFGMALWFYFSKKNNISGRGIVFITVCVALTCILAFIVPPLTPLLWFLKIILIPLSVSFLGWVFFKNNIIK